MRDPIRHVLQQPGEELGLLASDATKALLLKHDRDFQIGDTLVLIEEHDMLSWGTSSEDRLVIEVLVSHIRPASLCRGIVEAGYSILSFNCIGTPYRLDPGETVESLAALT